MEVRHNMHFLLFLVDTEERFGCDLRIYTIFDFSKRSEEAWNDFPQMMLISHKILL